MVRDVRLNCQVLEAADGAYTNTHACTPRRSIATGAEVCEGPSFHTPRPANALSARCPKDSEEKRLLDAMLLAVPR